MSTILTDTLIYVHPPKTGGVSVSSILKDSLVGGSYREVGGHPYLQGMSKKRDLSKYQIVATVRNPLDRMVSLWFIRGRHRGMKFSSFIASILSGTDRWYAAKPQTVWLKVNKKMPRVRLIRFEGFEQNLRNVMNELGLAPPKVIIHKNVTRGRSPNYKRYYRRCDVHAVADYYSEDLKLLGYRF